MTEPALTTATEASLSDTEVLEQFTQRDYKEGFYTDVESDSAPPGLDEGTIAFISKKRDDPAFTWEQAGELRINASAEKIDPTDGAE